VGRDWWERDITFTVDIYEVRRTEMLDPEKNYRDGRNEKGRSTRSSKVKEYI
jgi:hypothetical protein